MKNSFNHIDDAARINRKKNDLYDKKRSHYFDSIKIEGDTDFEKSYEVKKIVNKKIKTYEKISIIQYLIRWFDYESEYDEWKNLAALIDCMNLVHDYEKNETVLIKKNEHKILIKRDDAKSTNASNEKFKKKNNSKKLFQNNWWNELIDY